MFEQRDVVDRIFDINNVICLDGKYIYTYCIKTKIYPEFNNELIQCDNVIEHIKKINLYIEKQQLDFDKLLIAAKMEKPNIQLTLLDTEIKSISDSVIMIHSINAGDLNIWKDHIIFNIDKSVEILNLYRNLSIAHQNYELSKIKTFAKMRKHIPNIRYDEMVNEFNFMNDKIMTDILISYYFDLLSEY